MSQDSPESLLVSEVALDLFIFIFFASSLPLIHRELASVARHVTHAGYRHSCGSCEVVIVTRGHRHGLVPRSVSGRDAFRNSKILHKNRTLHKKSHLFVLLYAARLNMVGCLLRIFKNSISCIDMT